MSRLKIEMSGDLPASPKDVVTALEALAKALTSGPPEGAMALLVAFVHIHRAYLRPDMEETASINALLPTAFVCVSDWWPDAGKETPGDVVEIANQNDRLQ